MIIRKICELFGNFEKKVKSAIYLAAAVSDFYIPKKHMVLTIVTFMN